MARSSAYTTAPVGESAPLSDERLSKQEFGKRLYTLMLAKGWNQSQLARYAGIGRDSVSQYMRGRSYPTPQSLHALAKALSIEPEKLLPNYYESAVDRELPEIELKGVHGDPDNMWLRVNMRVSRAKALQVLGILNSDDEK